MHLTNHKSQRCSTSAQTTFIHIFSQKRLKPTKICLEVVNSFVSVSIVKMFNNQLYLTNYKSYRQIMNVQTTLIPILSQKRPNPTKHCLEAVNTFDSVFMEKIYHTPMHLTNHKSQRWSTSHQTFIPIFFQNRLKPSKNCLQVVNSFVRVFLVKMCHNPMHLTNQKIQRWIRSVQTKFISILSQKTLKPT